MHLTGLARLGRDAELRYTPSGDAVASLALAFSFRKGKEEGTQWIDASVWGKRAESLAPHLTKGTALYVILEAPHIETYQGKSGEGHKLVARVLDLNFAGKKQDAEQAATPSPPARRQQSAPQPAGNLDDDDLPF